MSSRILKGGGDADRSGADRGDTGRGDTPRLDVAPGRVIKKDVASAQEIARELRESAEAEAERIVATAKADAEALRTKAHEEGHAAGLAEWTDKVMAAARAEAERKERTRDDLVRLSIRIARKIIGREIESVDRTASDLVVQAVRGLHHEGRIRVHLRPEDLEKVQRERGRLVDEIGGHVEIELVQNPDIASGGCRVETPFGIVDASLETQLRVLEDALLGRKR